MSTSTTTIIINTDKSEPIKKNPDGFYLNCIVKQIKEKKRTPRQIADWNLVK